LTDNAGVSQAPKEVAKVGRIGAAAALMGASVLLSRLLGLARDMLLAAYVGSGAEADAYFAAFTIPDILNYMLAGGALSIALLPQYSQYRQDDEPRAERFLGNVLGTLGVIVVAATIGLWWFTPQLVNIFFDGFDAQTLELTEHLTRIVLPAQIFFVTGGIIKASLFARGRFLAAALAPLIYNLGIILGGLILASTMGVEGFAWGVLAGAFCGPLLAPLIDAWPRVRLSMRFDFFDKDFITYVFRALPLMLGASLLTVDEWYERIFGAALDEGTVGAFGYARRIMQVPVGVVGQAVGTAALPALTQLWAEGKKNQLNRILVETLQATLSVAALAGFFFFVFAEPTIVVLFERGRFTPQNTEAVRPLLQILSLAIPAWIVQQVASRAFYARGQMWLPMLLSTSIAIAAIPLYLVLRSSYGAVGLAWAGVIGMSVNALITLVVARFTHEAPGALPLLNTLVRATLVGAICCLLGIGAYTLVFSFTGSISRFVDALMCLVIGGLGFSLGAIVGLYVIGDAPSKKVLRKILGKLRITE